MELDLSKNMISADKGEDLSNILNDIKQLRKIKDLSLQGNKFYDLNPGFRVLFSIPYLQQ